MTAKKFSKSFVVTFFSIFLGGCSLLFGSCILGKSKLKQNRALALLGVFNIESN